MRELKRHRVSFTRVSDNLLEEAEDIIASYNIYASDALHAVTYKAPERSERLDGFLCDDAHFHRLENLVKAVTLNQIKIS